MDFQKFNQVHDSKTPRNFDLNLKPEAIESDDEFFISQLDHMHTSETSQNPTDQGMNINSNGLAVIPVAAAFNSENKKSAAPEMGNSGSSSEGGMGRSLRPRRVDGNYSDACRRVCTNYNCRTRNTPMWRKGPLGPKTLCNACGIQYKKQVSSRGSNQ